MKSIKYIVLFIFSIIWLAGTTTTFSDLADKAGLKHDGYQYGDLYKLSNLSAFRDPRQECELHLPVVRPTSDRPVHLYIIGDSFTEAQRIKKENFGTANYHYTSWNEMLHFQPDTTAINILLIECVERHFRERFATASLPGYLKSDTATFNDKGNPTLMQRLDDAFSANHAETRLDQLLFQNDLMLGLKQAKADFNYRVFGRANREVTLVNNDRDIVYYMDTDPDTTRTTSSFAELKNAEVDSLVKHINQSAAYAKSVGFAHVILSVIPNKVSVLAPDYGIYNDLIGRVYRHPALQVPFIDVLADFQQMGRGSYLKGDSHWTCTGQSLWLDKANQKIVACVKK